jgi:N6-L-threonylcarbamoyladenine synthase
MLNSGDLDFSFSGLKTAVLTRIREIGEPDAQQCADIARAFQDAIVDVLVGKAMRAMKESGLGRLVVAGGVGANRELRRRLNARADEARIEVFYPELEFCTDNGAMIALAGALRLAAGIPQKQPGAFAVRPRWPLCESAG